MVDVSDFPVDGAPVLPSSIPPRHRWLERFRVVIAILALPVWLGLTAVNPFRKAAPNSFVGALTDELQWGILAALLFLVALVAVCRWRDIGLSRSIGGWPLLRLFWLPAVYLLVFFIADVALGLPTGAELGLLLANTALGACSEELMFRGVLFGALRTRLRLWQAATLTTVLFGLAHLPNALVFGDFRMAVAQAVAAAMSGTLFIAMRVRTGSLLPPIVYHFLWDVGTLLLVMGALRAGGVGSGVGGDGSAGVAATAGLPSEAFLGPVLLLLPNFLYALFLLRKAARD